jgi:acylpyruvate hydrolase
MRLATISGPTGTRAARVSGGEVFALPYVDVATLLGQPDWRRAALAGGEAIGDATDVLGAHPVVRKGKTICVGLNYRPHILEVGLQIPEFPTLFGKFPETLAGATQTIRLPGISAEVDWEAELGVVIGQQARRVSTADALSYVAGFTVVNDVSMRDWQTRTTQWLPGKNFEASTPVGPVLVTLDEFDHPLDLELSCEVDGVRMQHARTVDLVFGIADIVSYVSSFLTLQPGDLIATGTPGGVAVGRPDRPFLRDGQVVTVTVEGLGSCRNTFVTEPDVSEGIPAPAQKLQAS